MFKQTLLIASAAAATLVAVPAAAEAQSYYGGYQPARITASRPMAMAISSRLLPASSSAITAAALLRPAAITVSRRSRCGKGTTGLIVGGAAGALLGREVERSGSRNRYYGGRSGGTTGAIIGGALGALVGARWRAAAAPASGRTKGRASRPALFLGCHSVLAKTPIDNRSRRRRESASCRGM